MIQSIIFFCFGVIYMGARSYAVSHCPVSLRPRLDELFDQADYGFLTTDEFIAQAAELIGDSPAHFNEMLNRQYHRDEKMIELIRALRPRYKVGLLSNSNDSVIRRLFSESELDELFTNVVISSEVGIIKPSPEIFELAAIRLDSTPDECVMIDDVACNTDAARSVGMEGIVFTDAAQCREQLQELGVDA
jgi:putative hydrolase of the HAD superfamily